MQKLSSLFTKVTGFFLISQFAFCMPGPIYTASEMNTGALTNPEFISLVQP